MANTSCTGLHNQPTFRTNSIGSSAVGSLFAAFLQLIAGVFPSDFFCMFTGYCGYIVTTRSRWLTIVIDEAASQLTTNGPVQRGQ